MEEIRADLVRELEGPYRKYLGELESELDSFKRCVFHPLCAPNCSLGGRGM